MAVEQAAVLQDSTFSLLEASTTALTGKQKRAAIEAALEASDVARLRELARAPGGFGGKSAKRWRRRAWPLLLGVESKVKGKAKEDVDPEPTARWEDLPPHRDERQVGVDVARSFVLYPSNLSDVQKRRLRELLGDLIVSVLRRHRALRYFQGFHDIVSVFLLSLTDWQRLGEAEGPDVSEEDLELLRQCVARLSLHRIRDSMTSTMEPVMGYLRIMQAILGLSSPTLSRLLSPRASSLPLFSLSWILTLTAHDLPTLPVVARLFDFLLAEDPVMASYVGAAICELKKQEVERMLREWGVDVDKFESDGQVEEGLVDDAMVHHVMAKLPPFRVQDDVDEEEEEEDEKERGEGTPVKGRSRPVSIASSSDFETVTTSSSVATLVESRPSIDESFHYTTDVDTPAFEKTPPPSPRLAAVKSKAAPATEFVPVESLVTTAISLYTLFPPSHDKLALEEIMGSKSSIFTWPALSIPGTLDDATAEAIIDGPVEDIVLPDKLALKEKERALSKTTRRVKRKREWEVTPAGVILVASFAGLFVAVWSSDQVRSWVAEAGKNWRQPFE